MSAEKIVMEPRGKKMFIVQERSPLGGCSRGYKVSFSVAQKEPGHTEVKPVD